MRRSRGTGTMHSGRRVDQPAAPAPSPHLIGLLAAAGESPALASDIAYGFNDPSTLFPWWEDPLAAEEKMAAALVP